MISIYSGGAAEPSVTSKTVFGPGSRSMQVSSLSWGYCLSRGKSYNYQGDNDESSMIVLMINSKWNLGLQFKNNIPRAKTDNFEIFIFKFRVGNFYVQQCCLIQCQCL